MNSGGFGVRIIASIMKKSFQKGVGDDSDLLRSVVGVAKALIIVTGIPNIATWNCSWTRSTTGRVTISAG